MSRRIENTHDAKIGTEDALDFISLSATESITETDDDAFDDVCDEDVAEWVGLHYRRNFAAASAADQENWRQRYREMHTR